MAPDPDSRPIAFELAHCAFKASVSMVKTAGSIVPTVFLSTAPAAPARILIAAAHYLALLAELGSGPADRWTIGIEIERVNLARVFVATASGAEGEVARARAMIEEVLVAAEVARPVHKVN